MSLLAKLFSKTLKPTEAEQEVSRLQGHVEILQDLCAQIVAQETPKANATVKRMAALARAGCVK